MHLEIYLTILNLRIAASVKLIKMTSRQTGARKTLSTWRSKRCVASSAKKKIKSSKLKKKWQKESLTLKRSAGFERF